MAKGNPTMRKGGLRWGDRLEPTGIRSPCFPCRCQHIADRTQSNDQNKARCCEGLGAGGVTSVSEKRAKEFEMGNA